jgi:hypothetical protein
MAASVHRLCVVILAAALLCVAGLQCASARQRAASLLWSDPDLSRDQGEDVFGAKMSPLPSVSSKINFAEEKLGDVWADLWVVGAGTLGSLVAEQWKAQFPDSRVVAETRSATRHEGFAAKGIEPRLRHERKDDERTTRCARHVLVCFPPSSFVGSQDLFEELAEACRLWAGPLGGGKLVYTSSTAVYGDSHGNTVTERFRCVHVFLLCFPPLFLPHLFQLAFTRPLFLALTSPLTLPLLFSLTFSLSLFLSLSLSFSFFLSLSFSLFAASTRELPAARACSTPRSRS